MGYSVKWVVENLGITRDMLRYYEKEKLLPRNESRNPTNKYRSYSDEDIERIWGIKLLISIGFTAKEIYAFMNDPGFDFHIAISKKVEELKEKHDEIVIHLEFAKSIKLSGGIPTVSNPGIIRFEDFLAEAHKIWNFYQDPRSAPFMQFVDTLISKPPQELNYDDARQAIEIFQLTDRAEMMNACVLHGYFQVIADMREFEHSSDTVQKVVRLFHKSLMNNNTNPELDGRITPQFIAKYIAPSFIDGDIAILLQRNYGEDGCSFIAQSLSYYGGYNIENL